MRGNSRYAEDPNAYWALHPPENEWDRLCAECDQFERCPCEENCKWGWCKEIEEFIIPEECGGCEA